MINGNTLGYFVISKGQITETTFTDASMRERIFNAFGKMIEKQKVESLKDWIFSIKNYVIHDKDDDEEYSTKGYNCVTICVSKAL